MGTIRIPLMRSTFFDEERTREALATFVRTAPKLSMGEQCAAFESAFAAWQGRQFAVLVSSGSAANLGLIQALINADMLHKGDAVGVSAVTWATNVMPLMQLGLRPVPIDCEPAHLNVSSRTLTPHIGKIKALFLTNALGLAEDLSSVRALCTKHNVMLLEDNCESLGSSMGGILLGNAGLASTFSFFVGHHLSTIEGGMICTDDPTLHRHLVMARAHGWDRNLSPSEQDKLREEHGIGNFEAAYTFYELAYNLRPTEITGFLGVLQLPLLERTIRSRESRFRRWSSTLERFPRVYFPIASEHMERVSNFAMPVLVRSEDVLTKVLRRFSDAGVETRPIIAGDITAHPFWKKSLPAARCEGARTIHALGFYFPNHPDLTETEAQELDDLLTNNV